MYKLATMNHCPPEAANPTTPVTVDVLLWGDRWPEPALIHCDGAGTGYEFTLEAEGDCGGGSYVVHWYIWLDEEPRAMDWSEPDEILWLPSEPDPDDPDDDPGSPEPVLVGGSDWYACH